MHKLILVLMALLLFSCEKKDSVAEGKVFFDNYQNYLLAGGDESKLIDSYFSDSHIIDVPYLERLSGTEINVLCMFMNDYKNSKFDVSSLQKNRIDEDFNVIKNFLLKINHPGNVYRSCVEPFLLEVEKGLRYKTKT
ncbi:hypothetical protein [Neptunicella marina]|uniref:Uncharacterized protein n=1 Tax=Neptunicella marina TaxID=2125989 RepID=A0A8J6LWT5_9ALTE|nr:hypothetical protein [Neptunicella marina]MBC3765324.1 hypothetical protein [Neptunicella marina]